MDTINLKQQVPASCLPCFDRMENFLIIAEGRQADFATMGQWPDAFKEEQAALQAKVQAEVGWAMLNLRCMVELAKVCTGPVADGKCGR